MATTSSGQYLCQRADERMTRRKPIARTCIDSVRFTQPSERVLLSKRGHAYKGKRDDGLEPSRHDCGVAEAAGCRDDIKGNVAAQYSGVTLRCSPEKSAPLGGIKERRAWEGARMSDVGDCRSLGVGCLRLQELTLHTASPYLPAPASPSLPRALFSISTVVLPPFFHRPGSPPDLHSVLS